MKKILLGLLLITSLTAMATTDYNVEKGRFHKADGDLSITSVETEESMKVVIDFNLKCKGNFLLCKAAKRHLRGQFVQLLPSKFDSEFGYLELEKSGKIKFQDLTITHQGRATIGRYTDAHKILVKPDNGKSEIIAFYHPEVGDAGWAKIEIKLILGIPGLRTYKFNATVK